MPPLLNIVNKSNIFYRKSCVTLEHVFIKRQFLKTDVHMSEIQNCQETRESSYLDYLH